MKLSSLSRAALIALAFSCVALAQQPGQKVGIINIQDAITRTQEGQELIKSLQEKYAPKQQELEGKQNEINDLRSQLSKGQNTLSEDAKRDLVRRIQQAERDAQRAVEDARGEFNREQQEIFNQVGGKLMDVIIKYAQDNEYSIVLNVSPDSPVLYATNEVNITNAVIEAFDGGAAAGGESGAAGKPAQ